MPKLAVGDLELNYRRSGAGEALLLIQGMSAHHRAWGPRFLGLLEESFETIVFDNRGMGLSSEIAEPFSIADMATDAVGLLDELEVERAHVLGISMGGMIAQELALAQPDRVRSLSLGCTYCGGEGSQLMDPDDFKGLVEAMASGVRSRVLREMYDLNLSPGFRAEESRYEEFAAMAAELPSPRKTIEFQLRAIVAHDTSARLPALDLPTMVLHGTLDRVLGYPNGPLIASLIPAARLETFEDVGHMFWWEKPEASAALIRDHALAPA